MAPVRKPLQGLWNVVRFNWHFYVVVLALAVLLASASVIVPANIRPFALVALGLLVAPAALSLVVTAYVYDFSDLYQLCWRPALVEPQPALLGINAGFDEISAVLQQQYATGNLQVFDFYDPARHTEVSIRRARRAYPPFPGTQPVDMRAPLPLADNSIDVAFAFLAAHEIRDPAERTAFFQEIRRVLKPTGQVAVTEHLRDPANFLAYTIGFLHFHSRRTWLATFQRAHLRVESEIKTTPFITTFLLRKDGTSA